MIINPNRPVEERVHAESHTERERQVRLAKVKVQRAARAEAMASLGLVRVRGALGGVYWE